MLAPVRVVVVAALATALPFVFVRTANAATDPNSGLFTQFGDARSLRTWDEAYVLAQKFVSQLTTAEKVSLTTGTGLSLGACSGNTKSIQKLGFPYFCLQDGPVGLRGVDLVTVFPAGITTASTWDRDLMYYRGRALGVENRIKGVNVALGPVAGPLGRSPAAGRNWEAFGADPYLQGKGNAESVRGLQDEGVIACVKHWVAYEQEHWRLTLEQLEDFEPILESISSNLDTRALKELYEWPFLDAVEAGVGSVMCSYQRVNGEYACESETLLREHLKGNVSSGGMGFRGFVVSDWEASSGPSKSAPAGLDMVMSGDLGLVGNAAALLPASDGALSSGTRLDEMVTRTAAAWYKMGQEQGWPNVSFDSVSSDTYGVIIDRLYAGQINFHVPANSTLHAELTRAIAADGTVLLKNTAGALPLSGGIKRIGVFGSDAGPIPSGLNSCGTSGECTNGTLAVGWGSGTGTFSTLVDPLQAITAKASSTGATVESVLDDFAYNEIHTKASGQDVCLAFINARSGEGVDNVAGNRGDRNNLTAWNSGDTLVETVASTCRNTVVVIHSVGAILLESFISNPNVTAVVLAHLPGQASGDALVDVLWGTVNPSGKLPYTIARSATDYCCGVLFDWSPLPQQQFSEGLLVDYRWFDAKNIQPRFEFGYGLSYTNFTYSSTLTLSPSSDTIATTSSGFHDTVLNITTSITNSGQVFGKEVAQLYIALPETAGAPVRQLRGFEKVALGPGETVEVVFGVTKRDLSVWDDTAGAWQVPKGEVQLVVGASSRDARASVTVQVA